jgi:uroporphyrinogen decarboxylase
MTMNAKFRVHAALRRQPVDRVPIWMWFHPESTALLAQALEIPAQHVTEALGDDIRQAWVSNNYAMEGIIHEREGDTHTDPWGIEWVKYGPFNQIRSSPLQSADEAEVRRYRYPYDHVETLLANMDPVMAEQERYFVGCDISPCLFEMVFRVRGIEQTLLDMAASPGLAHAMLAQAADFALCLAREACSRFALDWLWTGDDVGGQQGMILSPATWRDMIRPHLARIFEVGKSRGLWVAYHSCGSIRPIIPDLIEIGLDVLNPVQCNCPGMEPLELKREFGHQLAFMGGVDTQGLLPNGSAEEVYRETRRLVEGMTADGGGYILAASHAVPPETPLENILAMYEAAGVTGQEILDRAAGIRQKMETTSVRTGRAP